MKNATPNFVLALALSLLTAGTTLAQTSGRINYEGTQRTDMSQVRVMINGQMVKPGSPDFPIDIPESRSFAMTLSFAGSFAKEEQENNAMIRTMEGGPGGGGAPQLRSVPRPFQEATFLDLSARTITTLLTVKKEDNSSVTYRSDAPIAAPTGWTVTNQTKKIAGYTCRKATVPYRKETYTVWFTTDLPFTYSPVRDLTPEKGVVLALESDQQQYQAAKVDLKAAVAEADVRPAANAQSISAAELKDAREKALADFRQRMMEGRGGRN